MTSTALQTGDVVAGKYRIERVVGEGAMGVVLAAWHTELEQEVALKVLNDEALKNRTVVERFEREARSAVKIKSRHVARVSDVGKLDSGSPYMVMEYLEGHDLELVMAKDGPLPIVRAVDYVLQACDAIAEAHAYGIVHRDLKPANLFLADQGAGSIEVKVLDFGISKSTKPGEDVSKGMTHASEIFGSPMYMSPEQLTSSAKVDARADIWSLGIILYELVSGEPPFHEGTVAEIWSGILYKPIPLPREKRPSLPVALEKAILKALVRDVGERYQTIADFAEAIAPFGTGDAQACVDRAKRFRARTKAAGGVPVEPAPSLRSIDLPKPPPNASSRDSALDIDVDFASLPPPPFTPTPAAARPKPAETSTALAGPPRPVTPAPARTTTDWQSVHPPPRSKVPLVVLVAGVIAAVGGTAYFLRTHAVGETTTVAPAAATATATTTATETEEETTPPPPPTESASPGKHRARGPRAPGGRSAAPSASGSAAAHASAAPATSEPPPEPEEEAPTVAPEPAQPPPATPTTDPLDGAHRDPKWVPKNP